MLNHSVINYESLFLNKKSHFCFEPLQEMEIFSNPKQAYNGSYCGCFFKEKSCTLLALMYVYFHL